MTIKNKYMPSISHRKDGRYYTSVKLGYKENGQVKRLFIYGKTEEEVLNKVAMFNKNPNLFTNKDGHQRMGTLMKDWILKFKPFNVQSRTLRDNLANFNNHINNTIGDYSLDKVDVHVCQIVFNEMKNKNYSSNTIHKVKVLLNQFFTFCVEQNYIEKNPIASIKLRLKEDEDTSQKKDKTIPKGILARLMILLNEQDRFLKVLCSTLLFSGIRIGEALTLKWKDVDEKNQQISVNSAQTLEVKFDKDGKKCSVKTIEGKTKSSCSVRNVTVTTKLIHLLAQYKLEQAKTLKANNKKLTDDTYIFCNEKGEMKKERACARKLERFLARNDLSNKGIHFHAFRQTFSNSMLNEGVNPKIVQDQLGHKDVATTLRNYASVNNEYRIKSVKVVENAFSGLLDEEDDMT